MQRLQLSITVALLATFGWIMLQAGKQSQLGQMRQAFSTCWDAHNEINGESEMACGDAQERTHTEFICNQAGNCWVEAK